VHLFTKNHKGIQADENIKFLFSLFSENRKLEGRQQLFGLCQFLNPQICGSQKHLSLRSVLLGSNFEILINTGSYLGRKGNENLFMRQTFKSSEKLRSIDSCAVEAISDKESASIFRVRQ
jgi:hypothetical protein